MNILSQAFPIEREADQLHGLLDVARKVRASAAGGWVEDACDDIIAILKASIENEADEKADNTAAVYADWRHDQQGWNGEAY